MSEPMEVGFWRAGHGGHLTVEENRAHNAARDGYGACTWQRFATGGVVQGPSGSGDDTIPALLSGPGYVLPDGWGLEVLLAAAEPVEPPEYRAARTPTDAERKAVLDRLRRSAGLRIAAFPDGP